MYLVAFGIAFLLYRRQIRERNFPMNEDELSALFFWGILALLLGARIFATIVYETSDLYRRRPWLVFWPFQNGRFTGLQGMSYHGGVMGSALAVIIYSWRKKFDVREITDMFAASIPLGYTFGRLGNFINGELAGRITASPLGMIFHNAEAGIYPSDKNYRIIVEGAEKMGLAVSPGPDGALFLPRHPSQLYEALFEGIVLWLILWLLRNKKPFKGFLTGLYLIGYGFFRFMIEYFREPDAGLGYRIQLAPNTMPTALAHPLLSFSTGQIFSFVMILAGGLTLIIASRLPDRSPIRIYPLPGNSEDQAEKAAERNRRRKLRKKLR